MEFILMLDAGDAEFKIYDKYLKFFYLLENWVYEYNCLMEICSEKYLELLMYPLSMLYDKRLEAQ